MANITNVSDSDIELTLNSNLPVMLYFWAPWCGPCQAVMPVFDEIASEYKGQAVFAKINSDENPASCAKYGIRSIPMFLIFKNGKVEGQIVGAVPKRDYATELEKFL